MTMATQRQTARTRECHNARTPQRQNARTRERANAPCYPPFSVSESPDLVAALLSAHPAERERLLSDAEPGRLAAAIERLGQLREPAAAEVLGLIDSVI